MQAAIPAVQSKHIDIRVASIQFQAMPFKFGTRNKSERERERGNKQNLNLMGAAVS